MPLIQAGPYQLILRTGNRAGARSMAVPAGRVLRSVDPYSTLNCVVSLQMVSGKMRKMNYANCDSGY